MTDINSGMVVYLIVFFVLASCGYMYYDKSGFQLKCIISDVDGNTYCVRDRKKKRQAVDLLAKITQKAISFIEFMKSKYADDDRTKRLSKNFKPEHVSETLPNSTYTAYSENKGEKTAFCLTKKKNDDTELIDEHTLTFVLAHELTHQCTVSTNHTHEFWSNFKFILDKFKESGLHEPRDYAKEPGEYCSMELKDNPYYDMGNK